MKLFRTLCMEEPEGIDTMDLKQCILRAAGDPSTKSVNWPKPPKKFNSNTKTLTYKEYNDLSTRIRNLEGSNRCLKERNSKLENEIERLKRELKNVKSDTLFVAPRLESQSKVVYVNGCYRCRRQKKKSL